MGKPTEYSDSSMTIRLQTRNQILWGRSRSRSSMLSFRVSAAVTTIPCRQNEEVESQHTEEQQFINFRPTNVSIPKHVAFTIPSCMFNYRNASSFHMTHLSMQFHTNISFNLSVCAVENSDSAGMYMLLSTAIQACLKTS